MMFFLLLLSLLPNMTVAPRRSKVASGFPLGALGFCNAAICADVKNPTSFKKSSLSFMHRSQSDRDYMHLLPEQISGPCRNRGCGPGPPSKTGTSSSCFSRKCKFASLEKEHLEIQETLRSLGPWNSSCLD